MVSLLDIAPVKRTVAVRGQDLEVTGISAKGLAGLLYEYDELRALFSGRDVDFTPARIMEIVPEAIADIIAAGCGFPGDPRAREFAEGLTVGEQIDLLAEILDLTLPGGLSAFMGKLERLTSRAGVPMPGGGGLGAIMKEADSK